MDVFFLLLSVRMADLMPWLEVFEWGMDSEIVKRVLRSRLGFILGGF